MTQEEWLKIIDTVKKSEKGERLLGRPIPFIVTPEMYKRGKEQGWITKNDTFDWEKMDFSFKPHN